MPVPEEKERDVRNLLKAVTDLFICPLCCNLLTQPCQMQCRHVFCGPCIKSSSQKQGGGTCPHCSEKLNRRAMKFREDVTALNLAVGYMEDRILQECKQESEDKKREDEEHNQKKTGTSCNKSEDESEDDVDMIPCTPVKTKDVALSSSSLPSVSLLLGMRKEKLEPIDLRVFSSRNNNSPVRKAVGKPALKFVKPLDLSSRKRERDECDSVNDSLSLPQSSNVFKRIKQLQVFEDPTIEIKERKNGDSRFVSLPLQPKAVVKKQTFVFCPSRLTRVEMAKLSELCSVCDGRISKDYTDEVTHLIVKLERDRVPQTIKYFFAIADKKWVVVYDWVLECVFQGEMVSEDMYETSQFPECDSGVMKSRMNPSQLLTGVNIYFPFLLKACGASMDDCKKLVTKLGGRVIKTPCEVQQNVGILIIGDGFQNKHIYQEWFKNKGWLSVGWTWIIDCLLSYSIVPFTKTHLLIKLEQSSRVALPEALQRANRSTALSTHFSRSQDETHDNSSSGQDSEHIVPT